MRTKPLVNMRERQALRILQKVFSGTPHEAYTKVGMTEVMEPSPGEELSYEDRNYYMTSRFDYVACRGDLLKPVFALEFDGPRHESSVQQERDIRKNRLCAAASLPLLRVGPVELHPHERVSLLEFMLRRFVAWPTEEQRHLAEINERLKDSSPAEREELFEDGVLDPSIDPTFLFDIEHPFPGIAEVRQRLSRRFRLQDVYGVDRILDRGERAYWAWAWDRGAVGGYKAVSRCDFAVFEHDGTGQFGWHHESGLSGAARVFMSARLEFSMHHLLPIVHDFDPYTDTWLDYHARTGKAPYAFGELPGVFIPSITTTFALYLGLRRVEKWSRRSLQEVR
jgi:hypothetical protein